MAQLTKGQLRIATWRTKGSWGKQSYDSFVRHGHRLRSGRQHQNGLSRKLTEGSMWPVCRRLFAAATGSNMNEVLPQKGARLQFRTSRHPVSEPRFWTAS